MLCVWRPHSCSEPRTALAPPWPASLSSCSCDCLQTNEGSWWRPFYLPQLLTTLLTYPANIKIYMMTITSWTLLLECASLMANSLLCALAMVIRQLVLQLIILNFYPLHCPTTTHSVFTPSVSAIAIDPIDSSSASSSTSSDSLPDLWWPDKSYFTFRYFWISYAICSYANASHFLLSTV